ncbi:type II toxin-antitoxin system HicB family antitoxin [Desulfovulcanus sp.]
MKIALKIVIFQEGDSYVALAPEINVSSFGNTIKEAEESIKEAVELFFEECQQMGTFEQVLEEAGFLRDGDSWQPRKPIAEEELSLAI